MIEGIGLVSAAPTTPAGADAAPAPAPAPAGSFLQLLAGGFAAPAPLTGMADAAVEEALGDPVVSDADPAGFLSAWFGLAPLPPAANDAQMSSAGKNANAPPFAGVAPGLTSTSLPGPSLSAGAGVTVTVSEAGTADASALQRVLETAGLGSTPAGLALGLDVAADSAFEVFGTLVQDPGASLGARAVERLPPAAVPQALHVDADFEAALDAQLRWQVETGLSEAIIDLNPAELGALTIRIQMHGDQTSLHIHAAEAATRQLLQQLLPQMGERLAQSGLFYSGGEVRDRARPDREGEAPPSAGVYRTSTGRRLVPIHLVDTYV